MVRFMGLSAGEADDTGLLSKDLYTFKVNNSETIRGKSPLHLEKDRKQDAVALMIQLNLTLALHLDWIGLEF